MSVNIFVWFTLLCSFFLSCHALTESDVLEYMEDSVSEYKLAIHKAGQQRRRRIRKNVAVDDFLQVDTETAYESQVYNITPWQTLPTMHPVELEPFQISGKQYLAVVNFKNLQGKYQTNSAVYVINSTNNKFELLQDFATSGGIDFEYADLGNEKYAIFLDHVGQNWYGGHTYEKWFQLQQFLPYNDLERPFAYKTKVRALGAKRVKAFSKDGRNYFVTANSYYEVGDKYHVKSTIHVQSAFGYELVQSFDTQGAQDVEVIVIDNVRYILFVNHQDNSGKVDIYSVVYRESTYQEFTQTKTPFILYQRIATHGGRDFEYFTFENNHYLAAANEYTQITAFDSQVGHYVTIKNYNIDSVIYWWTGTMWVEWQKIPTEGAVKWSYMTSTYGDPMLVVANSKAQAVIFTYDPLRGFFKPTEVQGLSPFPENRDMIPDVRSVMSFSVGGRQFLAVANYNESTRTGYNIFEITFIRKVVPKLDPSVPEIVSSLLAKMKIELEQIKNTLSKVLLEVTHRVVTKSTDQNITVNMSFKNLTIETLVTNNTYYHDNVTVNPIELSAKEAFTLKQLLHQQEQKLLELQAKLGDAVRLNDTTHVTGYKTFLSEVHAAKNLNVVNTTKVVGLVDGTNVTDLQNRAWSKTQDQSYTGNYKFNKTVTVGQNASITGKLNGKRMDSLMTLKTTQTISSIKEFQGHVHVASNTTLTNFELNSFNVPDDFVVDFRNQTITGHKIFNNVVLTNVTVDGLVDDVNLTVLHDERLTLTTSQSVDSVTLNTDTTVLSSTEVGGLVDGVNITSFYYDVIHGGGSQVISGPRTFQSVHILASLNSSLVNGYNLDDAVTTDTEQTLLAEFKFEEDVRVDGDVITNSTIDTIDLSEHAVIKYGNQTIHGHKRFSAGVYFDNDILVSQLVDGVDVKNWKSSAVTYNTVVIGGSKSYLHPIIQGNFTATDVNDIQLSTLKDGLIPIDSDGNLNQNLSFQNVIVRKNLSVSGEINGYRIPNDFITLNTNQVINGSKTFSNTTIVTGSLNISSNLNGENFTKFYEDAVRNGTNQSILSTTFLDDVNFNKVVVDGTVNGFSIPDDIVTINTVQNISGEMIFSQDTVFQGVVNTFVVHVNETVDDIDVSEMERNAVYKNRNQTINGSIIFVGGVDCKQNVSVAGLINGVNLTELVNSAVRISRNQSIFGKKEFDQDVQFHNIITSPGTVNNVNLQQLNATVMKTDGDQHIPSDVIFRNNVTIVNLTTSNTSDISGINFQEFLKNAFRRTSNNTIRGNISYVNLKTTTLTSEVVDGVNMSTILLTNGDQDIKGTINFSSIIVDNVTVVEMISGVNITELDAIAVKLDTNQSLTGKYTFQNVTVNGDVYINGYLNGVNLTEYGNSVVYLNSNDTINGVKTFNNVSFENVIFEGLLNGINMSLVVGDSLKRSGDQKVCMKKTFLAPVIINATLVDDISVHGLLNLVNVTNLFQNGVMLNNSQILLGNYDFLDGLHVADNLTATSLNNLDIPNDMVMISSDQNITGAKFFHDVNIRKNLSVNGTLDGVNVQELNEIRVTLSTNQSVSGKALSKALVNNIIFHSNGTINGIDISEELIKTNEDSIISGEKYFQNVTVIHDINSRAGIVNNINLPEFSRKALKTESEEMQELTNDQRFLHNVTIEGDLTVVGFINGVKVGPTKNYSSTVSDTIKDQLLLLTDAARVLCNSTTELLALSSYGTSFSGVKRVFTKMFSTLELGRIDTYVLDEMVFVSIGRPYGSICGDAYVLKCTIDMTSCLIINTLQTNSLVLEFMEYNNFTALNIFHQATNTTTSCKQVPEIYIYSAFTQKFEPYQTLNEEVMTSLNAPLVRSKNVLKKQFGKKNAGESNGKEFSNTVEFFQKKQKNYIAATGTDELESDYVDVFEIGGSQVNNLVKKQRINVGRGRGKNVAVGKSPKSGKSKAVLAVSSLDKGAKIKLYKEDESSGEFKFYQTIDDGASSMTLQDVGNTSVLSYTNPSKGVGFCTWQGASGYDNCNSLHFTDTDNVNMVVTSSGAFTLAVTENQLLIFKSLFDGAIENYSNSTC